jgi:hypothetical protein
MPLRSTLRACALASCAALGGGALGCAGCGCGQLLARLPLGSAPRSARTGEAISADELSEPADTDGATGARAASSAAA